MKRKCAERIRECWKSFPKEKLIHVMFVLILLTIRIRLLAQTKDLDGTKGLQDAEKEVSGYFDSGADLMYAIGAIVGIVGAIKVYNKWNSGDQDTGKAAAAWFGSCIFLLVVATVLKGFFGV